MPKFQMPWWWQVLESGIVGFAAGGVVVFIRAGIQRMLSLNEIDEARSGKEG